MKTKNEIKRGFTLVEALVAISILMLAVTGPMVVAQKGLFSAISSKDQMIAAFLAQDAIEYIKNVRDSNGVKVKIPGETLPNGWLSGLGVECIKETFEPNEIIDPGCNVDTLNNGILGSINPQMCVRRENDNFLGYGIVGDSKCSLPSKFSRYIKIKRINDADEAYVDVLVKWGEGSDQRFEVGSYIYNYWGDL